MREPNRYQPLKDQQQNNTADENGPNRPGALDRTPAAMNEAEHTNETKDAEARLADYQRKLEEQLKAGKISRQEFGSALKQFDNMLVVEMQHTDERAEGSVPAAQVNSEEREADKPTTHVEKEVTADEHDRANRGEMTDVRAARLERLRNIERKIEFEFQENAANMLDRDASAGDRSR